MKGLVLYALLEAFVLDFGMHLLSYAVGLITGYPPFAVSGAEEIGVFFVLLLLSLAERVWKQRRAGEKMEEKR